MATVICPSCGKEISVPSQRLGRWIACPVCLMEFAALVDEPEPRRIERERAVEDDEPPPRKSPRMPALVVSLGLLFLVLIVGVVTFAVAKNSSKKAGGQNKSGGSTSSVQMPPIDRHANSDLGLGLPSLQQSPLEGMFGIMSSIKSIMWWTTVLSVLHLVSAFGILVWMARDSRNRGMENIASWVTVILFTGVFGFAVYWLARPKGTLVNCRHCNNRCLENALNCPHCRRKAPRKKRRLRDD